jgi:hypothetical protein
VDGYDVHYYATDVFHFYICRVLPGPSIEEGPHVDETFWDALQNAVGFYIGYAILAGTLASYLHTIMLRRLEISATSHTILLGGLLGLLALVPQALVFGFAYWLVNIVTGILAGLAYGVLVTLSPFR